MNSVRQCVHVFLVSPTINTDYLHLELYSIGVSNDADSVYVR